MNAKFFSSANVATLVMDVNQHIQEAGIAPGLITDLRVSIKPTLGDSDEIEILLMSDQPNPSTGVRPQFEIIHGTPETFPKRFERFARGTRSRGKTFWHTAHCAGVRSDGVWTHLYAVITHDGN